MNNKKVALIESGTSYHYFSMNDEIFSPYFNETIYAPELSKVDLSKFDIVILADRNHIKYLLENKNKLNDFAKNGGTLCILGENHVEKWLENVNFTPTDTNFWWWLEPDGDIGYKKPDENHQLFRHVSFEECKWHYHGVFEPSSNAIRIIERKDELGGGAIMYEESFGKGKIIITSLDPFFHIGSNFMPNTNKYLKGLLLWLINFNSKNKKLL